MGLSFNTIQNGDIEVFDSNDNPLGEISWRDGGYMFYPDNYQAITLDELEAIIKHIKELNHDN